MARCDTCMDSGVCPMCEGRGCLSCHDGTCVSCLGLSAADKDYREAKATVERLGMSIKDGLGLTVAGGYLVDGTKAPSWIQDMNGWPVEDIAIVAARQTEPST